MNASMQVRRLADVRKAKHHHEHAGEAEAVSPVRRTPVAEEIQIVLNRSERKPFLLGLLHENRVAVFPLRPRCHLESLPEKVETLGMARVALVPHVIERPYLHWVICNKDEFVTRLLLEVLTQKPFALRIQVALLAFVISSPVDVVSHLVEDVVRLLHGDSGEGNLGYNHFRAESGPDLVAEFVPRHSENVPQPTFLEAHQILVRLDPGNLDVDARELSVVTRSDRRVGSKHGPDFEHAVETGRHRHLLEELRRLGEVREAIEVLDAEEFGPELACISPEPRRSGDSSVPERALIHEFWGVNLDEPLRHPEEAHGVFKSCLEFEDEQVARSTQVKESPVQPCLERRVRVERQGRVGPADNGDQGNNYLDPSELDRRIQNHLPGDLDGALGGKVIDERSHLEVRCLLMNRLHSSGVVADHEKLRLPLAAQFLNPSANPDGFPFERT